MHLLDPEESALAVELAALRAKRMQAANAEQECVAGVLLAMRAHGVQEAVALVGGVAYTVRRTVDPATCEEGVTIGVHRFEQDADGRVSLLYGPEDLCL